MAKKEIKEKSRELSFYKYLKRLQFEYIEAEFRRKIYPCKSDKLYYEKVMEVKKIKIEDISIKNNLPNIFKDEKVKEDMYKKFYPVFGYPNIEYREDSLIDQKKKTLDELNYYKKGTLFNMLMPDGTMKIGKLNWFASKFSTVEIIDNNLIFHKGTDQVSRIF